MACAGFQTFEPDVNPWNSLAVGLLTLCSCLLTDNFSEESLQAHDQEVTRVKQYYKENEEMLEKVERRQKLWLEFLEFEVLLYRFL